MKMAQSYRVCMRQANALASVCTGPTGLEPTRCSTSWSLASAVGGRWLSTPNTLIGRAMEKASVFRTDESLADALAVIGDLRQRFERITVDDKGTTFNNELTEAMELGNLLDISEALVVGARARTESRGGHFREDFPKRDDKKWMRHTLVTRSEDGSVSLSYKPVVQGPYEPMERKY